MSIRTYPVYPQQRYLDTDSTQSALSLTAGRKAVTTTGGKMFVGSSTVHRIVPLDGARGVTIQFFGTDAANEIIANAAIWGVTFPTFSGATVPNQSFATAAYCDLLLFGTAATITLGTAAGVDSGDLVPATSFIADTIATWTINTGSESVYGLGTTGEYSPADNTPAYLSIPNFGAFVHGFVIEFDMNTSASGNALYTLTG